jgi:hypothetical protein
MIPASVTDALTSLQAQVAAALPLENATLPTIQALQLNAAALVGAIDVALANAATMTTSGTIGVPAAIDTWVAPVNPEGMIAGVNALYVSAADQWNLSVMRGLVGRVATNLDQLGPIPTPIQPSKIFSPMPPAPQLPAPERGHSFLAKFARTNLKSFRFNQ